MNGFKNGYENFKILYVGKSIATYFSSRMLTATIDAAKWDIKTSSKIIIGGGVYDPVGNKISKTFANIENGVVTIYCKGSDFSESDKYNVSVLILE